MNYCQIIVVYERAFRNNDCVNGFEKIRIFRVNQNILYFSQLF